MSETDKKQTEAEEIFSEFQKTKESNQETEQIQEPQPEPTPEPKLETAAEPEQPAPSPQETEQVSQESEPEKASSDTVAEPEKDSAREERNVIFIGIKPIMTYVTATLTQLAIQPVVTIKARGKRITLAVDVSQMIVKRMSSVGFKIGGVRIASDSLTSQDGKLRNVSTIEIDVTKT